MQSQASKPLATLMELELVWKGLGIGEEERATAILIQASNFLRQIAKNNGFSIDQRIEEDPSGIYESNVKTAVLNATQRVMATPTDMMPDASNWSQNATPYSTQITFGQNAQGNIYFKTKELEVLGIRSTSGRSQLSILRGVRG